MNKFLLDTHTWIWIANDELLLSTAFKAQIKQASVDNQLYLTAISLWEVSMLETKQRLTLSMPCRDWMKKTIELMNIQVVAITPAIAIESCSLPGNFHSDPADRLIVATARDRDLTILTRDRQILEYSDQNYCKAIKI